MPTYNAHETTRMIEVHGSPLASFWDRGLAFLLDLVFMSVLFAVVGSFVEPLLRNWEILSSEEELTLALNLNWYSIAWSVLYFGLATWIGNGQTPGKALLGIRTVSLVHTKMTLWHSIERALGYGASLLEFGFGFFQYFIHPNKRTVHDRIAETIVVTVKKERASKK